MIHKIIEELNLENGSNYKIAVLKKHADNELLQRVLKMTYDKVTHTYGMSLSSLDKIFTELDAVRPMTLEQALDHLELNICNRNITGHDALHFVNNLTACVAEEDAEILRKIINRDLRINLGKTQINKVFKNLITKPVYMRCDVYGPKTKNSIKYPAVVELKADGTYREMSVHNGHVTSRSRSGESYEYPVIFEQMSKFPDGIYVGELTIAGISDRAEGNGLINSDEPPHEDIIFETWDFITHDEYEQARLKDKKNPCKTDYQTRFRTLESVINNTEGNNNIKIIPYEVVNDVSEALKKTSEWMSAGYEGSVLKCWSGVFKDGTPKYQLKLKLCIDADVRITGTKDGTVGTKREGKVGAILFETDDGKVKGACSGFSDKQMDEFTKIRDELPGKIMAVQFNDLSKGRNNEYYALSHPRFMEIRNDKDETDTLERLFQLREMAMELS